MGVPGEELSGLFDIVHLIETDQIDGQTSHDGLHQRDLTCSCATGIFFKADVFDVVQCIFDFPMAAYQMKKRLRVGFKTGDIVMDLCGVFPAGPG